MRGRIRSVKPEVLSDEDLWDLGQQTGWPVFQGFEGLWMFADREGRFEWRPRALKTVILPYWDGNFEELMTALVEAGFLQRYEVDGRFYGRVRNFLKHQTPNAREPASQLPAPPKESASPPARTCVHVQDDDASGARTEKKVSSGNGLGTEGNGSVAPHARDTPSAHEPGDDAPDADRMTTANYFAKCYRERYAALRGGPPGANSKLGENLRLVATFLDEVATNGRELEIAVKRLLDGFFSDSWAIGADFPLTALAGSPRKYYAPISPANQNGTNASLETQIAALRTEKRRYCAGPDFSIAEQQRIDAEIQRLERQLPKQVAGGR